jgi:hypothetical protein
LTGTINAFNITGLLVPSHFLLINFFKNLNAESMNPKVILSKNGWYYSLIMIPVVFAFLALVYHDFIFKACVAGSGIVIIIVLQFIFSSKPRMIWMIPVAFLFSIAGDWFLSHRQGETDRFIEGIVMFFIAHVGYLLFALRNGKLRIPVLILLLAVYLPVFFIWLSPGIENTGLRAAALMYLLISCVSLGAATGIQTLSLLSKWFFAGGIFSLLFSDTIIAFEEFAGFQDLSFLILPTYYLSQICLTFAMMKAVQRTL